MNPDTPLTREARRALVADPATPAAAVRRLLPQLFWRELVEIAGNPRLSPVVRRQAETIIRARLPELASGERVALARVASAGLVAAIGEDGEAGVLQALAGNPRLTEEILLRILARAELPRRFLAWLAESSAWESRGAVRVALARHPGTPPASALRVVATLPPMMLEELLRGPAIPRLVRVAVDRRLGVDTASDASLQSPVDRWHPGVRGLSTSR